MGYLEQNSKLKFLYLWYLKYIKNLKLKNLDDQIVIQSKGF